MSYNEFKSHVLNACNNYLLHHTESRGFFEHHGSAGRKKVGLLRTIINSDVDSINELQRFLRKFFYDNLEEKDKNNKFNPVRSPVRYNKTSFISFLLNEVTKSPDICNYIFENWWPMVLTEIDYTKDEAENNLSREKIIQIKSIKNLRYLAHISLQETRPIIHIELPF
ncbi:hypothetical protein [Allofrancisella inopinata]|nr:hypothetical protein [Allofrancisella inopinata]